MDNEIISYLEMCRREGASLQRGMNFQLRAGHSVILMSRRANAPYQDHVEPDGITLIYEGHDVPRSARQPNPKAVDQPERTPSGSQTQNGLFHAAAQQAKRRNAPPEVVRVYEKIRDGVWAYNGLFDLVDSWRESSGGRTVFKFKLTAIDDASSGLESRSVPHARRRVIPTHVKVQVWQRDRGRCVVCGRSDELHFDHVLPFSKGGTSITAENVQLLCARHNLAKRDKII
jgi:HNH endonuclease